MTILQLSPDELRQILSDELKKIQPLEAGKPEQQPEQIISGDKELAERLGCTVQTIHKLRHAGALPFYRFGHRVYYKAHEVDQALKVNPRKFTKKGGPA